MINNSQLNLWQSGIRDNDQRGSVADFLQDQIKPESQLSIVSAYFTIYAFEALREELLGIKHLNFLFGEPRFVQSISPNQEVKAFQIEDDQIELGNKLQQSRIARECEKWIEEKVSIRSVKQTALLHGKMYHISSGGKDSAILGSSNFTIKGLGLGKNNNIELNLVVDSDRDRHDLKCWFDEIWHNQDLVQDVKDDVISYLKRLYQNNTPQFIYYKTLYHLFFQFLIEQETGDRLTQQQHLTDTEIWQLLFDFQKDGVKGAINKLLVHNGCIIADSVGLGKTFEALAIIKYFELLNYRVLVLCPKKLRENWTVYHGSNNSALNTLLKDRFNYTVLSHTDLSRDTGKVGDIDLATVNWGNYDLVVIDESHNFRNHTKGKRDEDGNIIKKSRYERLLEDVIKQGVKTKVLLLSATPVNNDLKDLWNQLHLISEGKDDTFASSLNVKNIQDVLKVAQGEFTKWAKEKNRQQYQLLERLSGDFFSLLDGLTIARSRKDVQQYYTESVSKLGDFPERLKPISIFPNIDLDENFMDYDQINDEISRYQLSLFKPSSYILEEYKHLYQKNVIQQNFTQENRENYLIGMMKVNFLKRLESSVYAFQITLERTINKIKDLEAKIAKFKDSQSAEMLDENDLWLASDDDEELDIAFEVGTNLKFNLVHLDIEQWLNDLSQDREQLNNLYLQAKDINTTRDAKLAELQKLIENKVKNPTKNKHGVCNRKVIVFTAFADTAKYLYDALKPWVIQEELKIHLALVTGSNQNKTSLGNNNFDEILTNFAPIAKNRSKIPKLPQDEEIDLLIATDCISEGQNLQDCDYLINYDIHWNPVRIIQRFGRIDRIGSRNTSVQMVNFWATDNLDKYINLKTRVEARMALVDITATGTDNLLKHEDRQEIMNNDLHYRRIQLERLQKEVLDLEDFDDTVSLNEFTLDDFRIDLLNYIQQHQKILENAPLGLYAVVPPGLNEHTIPAGVIFCLQQKGDTSGNEKVNPLQPYFLIYMKENGEIRHTFVQPKQILDIYRGLCSNQTEIYKDLCDLFDQATNHGYNMVFYSNLLEGAIANITETFKVRSHKELLSGRSAKLISNKKMAKSQQDFDLITWLVIKNRS